MTIEKPYQRVRDIEGLHDHLIKIVEDNDERFLLNGDPVELIKLRWKSLIKKIKLATSLRLNLLFMMIMEMQLIFRRNEEKYYDT